MQKKHVCLMIVAGLTWTFCLSGMIALLTAIGSTSILWMIFAVSCVMDQRVDSEQVDLTLMIERDIL